MVFAKMLVTSVHFSKILPADTNIQWQNWNDFTSEDISANLIDFGLSFCTSQLESHLFLTLVLQRIFSPSFYGFIAESRQYGYRIISIMLQPGTILNAKY